MVTRGNQAEPMYLGGQSSNYSVENPPFPFNTEVSIPAGGTLETHPLTE